MTFDQPVFEPDAAWKRALEKLGAATHLSVELYVRDDRLIFGPAHPTSLFDLLAPVAAGSDTEEEGEVFLLILLACGYVVYLGIRLCDKERARKMVQRVMKSKVHEPALAAPATGFSEVLKTHETLADS